MKHQEPIWIHRAVRLALLNREVESVVRWTRETSMDNFEIAELLGTVPFLIERIREGLVIPWRPTRKYNKKRAKLDAGKVLYCRAMVCAGLQSYADLAAQFGVHRRAIEFACTGYTYKWVWGPIYHPRRRVDMRKRA